jgi:hypothetical protein
LLLEYAQVDGSNMHLQQMLLSTGVIEYKNDDKKKKKLIHFACESGENC